MIKLSDYIVPVIFIVVLLLSLITKKDAYNAYVEGSGKAVPLVISVFPYLLSVMIAVSLFRFSGISSALSKTLAPVFNIIGIPSELTELIIIRPVSGAGALAVLENVYNTYGVDSFIGNCASVIYGSSETIFYITAIYFSSIGKRKTGYAVPVALVSTFLGYVIGCALIVHFV